ncbi:ictacalcin-like [Clarias gariepinus]|uniref:ictacalcin-like n=1 Tax=Clarias gariepinus TaxID=13013 RepID=UPI00234DAB33|nr:ictacalcin-like [Clarias gariepinus]
MTHFLLLPVYFCWSRSLCKPTDIMSKLPQAMTMLIDVFYKYSGKEGDKFTLSKGELKDLLNTELGNPAKSASNQAQVEKIFKDLDANADGVVDFQEYVTLVACITMACNEFFDKKK